MKRYMMTLLLLSAAVAQTASHAEGAPAQVRTASNGTVYIKFNVQNFPIIKKALKKGKLVLDKKQLKSCKECMEIGKKSFENYDCERKPNSCAALWYAMCSENPKALLKDENLQKALIAELRTSHLASDIYRNREELSTCFPEMNPHITFAEATKLGSMFEFSETEKHVPASALSELFVQPVPKEKLLTHRAELILILIINLEMIEVVKEYAPAEWRTS